MCSIDDMLAELETSRDSISKQTNVLNEIITKSNNVLLQLESERSSEKTDLHGSSSMEAFAFKRETEQSLAKLSELFQHLPLNNFNRDATQITFSDYMNNNCENLQQLNSNVRKLLVIGEIMRNALEENRHDITE